MTAYHLILITCTTTQLFNIGHLKIGRQTVLSCSLFSFEVLFMKYDFHVYASLLLFFRP